MDDLQKNNGIKKQKLPQALCLRLFPDQDTLDLLRNVTGNATQEFHLSLIVTTDIRNHKLKDQKMFSLIKPLTTTVSGNAYVPLPTSPIYTTVLNLDTSSCYGCKNQMMKEFNVSQDAYGKGQQFYITMLTQDLQKEYAHMLTQDLQKEYDHIMERIVSGMRSLLAEKVPLRFVTAQWSYLF
jgi:hypothetical protein